MTRSQSLTAGDGARLHVGFLDRTGGDAPPAVVLAGGVARDPEYLGDLAGLDQARPLALLHQRGVPPSEPGEESWRRAWWHLATDVEVVRAALGCERVDLVAHSAGSRVALAYAARHRHRVASLTLLTPDVGGIVDAPPDVAELIAGRTGDAETAAARALAGGPPFDDEAALRQWQLTIAPLGYADWDDAARRHAEVGHWHLPALADFYSLPAPDGLAASLAVLPVPTLLVAGADDCLTGVSRARALAELLPSARLVVLPDCGHYPWVEQPDALREVVAAFWRDSS